MCHVSPYAQEEELATACLELKQIELWTRLSA